MAQLTPETWAATLLKKLGIHQTPGAVQALVGWAKAEGGHWNNDARYNPLNTTQNESGAKSINSVGVKSYGSLEQGLQATVETLRNGRYNGILSALAAGNPNAVASAVGETPWGTNAALVKSAISSTPRVAGIHALGVGGGAVGGRQNGSAGATNSSTTTTTRTIPGVDNGQQRLALTAAYLANTHNPDALTALAAGLLGARDTPAQTVTSSNTTRTQSPRAGTQGRTSGQVVVSPGAERPGIGLQKPILSFLHQLAGASGRTVDVTTGTAHNRMTTSGNVSDHWGGNAADLGVGGDARQSAAVAKKGDLIAAHAIQVASGKSFGQALAMARQGGVWNFETKQGRVQILWKTLTGGNHYNHVHVGVNPNR